MAHYEAEEVPSVRILTLNNFREILEKYEKASDFLKDLNPNAAVSGTVVHKIGKALTPYCQLYGTRKSAVTRAKLTSFFSVKSMLTFRGSFNDCSIFYYF